PRRRAHLVFADAGHVQRADHAGLGGSATARAPVGPVVAIEAVEQRAHSELGRQSAHRTVELDLAEVAAIGVVARVVLALHLPGVEHADADAPPASGADRV